MQSSLPFTNIGKPAEHIIELLKITDIQHDSTATDIITKTQAQWIRKPGTERWEIDKQDYSYHDALHAWLEKNNFVKEIRPHNKKYDYLVIMGGLAQRVKGRIQYAQELLKSGIICNKIIVLCGERPLDAKQESFEMYAFEQDKNSKTIAVPATETGMMRYIIERSNLDPRITEWYSVSMIDAGNNQKRRPTTADTVNMWIATQPKPGQCLIISMQPHAHYQDAVVRTLMPTTFTVETIAPEFSESVSDGDYLDNLARWMYQGWEFIR